MAASRVAFFQSTNGGGTPATTAAYGVTPSIGDLVVVDVVTNSAATVCTAISGGGVATWTKVGTEVTSTSGFLVSTVRFMGVVTSTASTTITPTYTASPSDSKIDGVIVTDVALRPNVAWSVDADHSTKITTAATAMAGFALTSTGTNGVEVAQWVPQNTGAAGATAGWTYNVDTVWTNVVATRLITATGSIGAPAASQSPSGSYARRLTIFQAAASGTTQTAAATTAGAGAVTVDGRADRVAAASVGGAGTMSAAASQGVAAQAVVAGGGAVSAAALRGQPSGAMVTGAGSTSATATRVQLAQAAVVGAGQMQAIAGSQAAATVTGAGATSASASQGFTAQATVSGSGVASAGPRQGFAAAATIAGAGVMLAGASRGQPAGVAVIGAGAMTALATRVHNVRATVAGTGSVTASGTQTRVVATGVSGVGRMTATATVLSLLNASLWVVDRSTGSLTPLPHWVKLNASPIRNSPGAINVEYPVRGRGFDLLRAGTLGDGTDVEVELWLGGSRTGARRALLMQTDGEDLDGRTTWTFSGMFLERLLAEGIIGPQAPPAGSDKVDLVFTNATVGTIVATILHQCQSRGALTAITRDWTTSVDSGGVAWSTPISITFAPKTTILAVLQRLAGYGLCEFAVTAGRVLQIWRPEGRGVDRSVANEPPMFRHRRVLSASRRHSVLDSYTAALGVGKDGAYAWATDPTAEARYGRRREAGVDVGELSDTGSVQAAAQRQLAADAPGQTELVYELAFGVGDPVPGRGFDVGDWVPCDTQQTRVRNRVVQWTLTLDRVRGASGSATMNDLLADRRQRLQSQLDAVTSGAVVIGTSNPPDGPDTVAPSAPTGVNASSLAYGDGAGGTLASVLVGWAQVSTNPGPPPIATDDVAGYKLEYSYSATAPGVWNLGKDVEGGASTTTSFGELQTGAQVSLRVKAYDRTGNTSAPSSAFILTTETDDTAPPVPSTPILAARVNIFSAEHDGRGAAGEVMPLDTRDIEVHLSAASGFTANRPLLPDGRLDVKASTTYYDRIPPGGGIMPVTGRPYGAATFVVFVAVDSTNNASGQSAQASATPSQVLNADIFDGAVGTSKLGLLVVKTANIDNAAVNAAQIGTVNAGSIITGTMSALLTLSGLIRTDVSPNRRMEIDGNGWHSYTASNVLWADLNVATQTMLVTGTYQTAMSGQRLVLNPGGTKPDAIRVFPSGGGGYGQIMARTAPADGSAAILIDGGVGASTTTARGRLGAYKGEAFVSFVAGDDSGDGAGGYSRTAVSCNNIGVNIWAQNSVAFDKYSGNDFLEGSHAFIYWTPGSSSDYAPGFGASTPNSMVKLDAGRVLATTSDGAAFVPVKGTVFEQASTAETKTDIVDIRQVMSPLDRIRAARAKAWKYIDEVAEQGDDAPIRFGPIAEDLPVELVHMSPKADGSGMEPSVDLGSLGGTTWGALNQIIDQQIVATSAVAVLPANQLQLAGIFKPGESVEVAVTWDSAPPAAPTGGLAQISSAFIWAGKVTAWVKTGSCTSTGCRVVFKNISTSTVVVSNTNDLTRVVATVTGLGLYSPPYVPPGA